MDTLRRTSASPPAAWCGILAALTAIVTLALGTAPPPPSSASSTGAVAAAAAAARRPAGRVATRWTTTGLRLRACRRPTRDWETQSTSLGAGALLGRRGATSPRGRLRRRLHGVAGFFDALGARARSAAAVARRSAADGLLVAVITDAYWRKASVRARARWPDRQVSNRTFTIAAVLEPRFRGRDVHVPSHLSAHAVALCAITRRSRGCDGVTVAQANAQIGRLPLTCSAPIPTRTATRRPRSLRELVVGQTRATLTRCSARSRRVARRLRQRRQPLPARATSREREIRARRGRRGRGRWSASCSPKARCSALSRRCRGVAGASHDAGAHRAVPARRARRRSSVDGTALLFVVATALASSLLSGLAGAAGVARPAVDACVRRQGIVDRRCARRLGTERIRRRRSRWRSCCRRRCWRAAWRSWRSTWAFDRPRFVIQTSVRVRG